MFISGTQCFVYITYSALFSKLNCLKKIAVGDGWVILSVGRIHTVDLR